MAKLAAIITAYNRADFIGKGIESVLRDAGDGLDIEVIVMDNGSKDGSGEVAKQAGARVERTEDNRHIVEVINRGFDLAHAIDDVEYILYLNDDTEFTPGSLRKLVDANAAHPNSVMTPLQLNYREPSTTDSGAFEHLKQVRPLIEDALLERPLKEVYPLPTIIGAAMFARAETWQRIGEFDPLFWFYGVDDDICTRARWLGCETLLVTHAHLLHAHGKLDVAQQAATKAQQNMK
jgi:GT2 family glycosyltransferase